MREITTGCTVSQLLADIEGSNKEEWDFIGNFAAEL